MTKNQYTESEITLRELLAVIVRGGRCVLALAVVLALVLGLYSLAIVSGDDPMHNEEYRIALEAYRVNKEQKEASIDQLKKDIEKQETYNQKSLLMQVDPDNKHVTTMTFVISGIDISATNESFSSDETPISYMTERIQAQYNTLWKQINLEKLVEGTTYEGVEETYLREMITFSVGAGGMLSLSVIGSDVASCGKIINAVYTILADSKSVVERASYAHDFVPLHEANTKVSEDAALEKKQLENQQKIETDKAEILKLEKELLKLEEPANPFGMMYVAKRVILGGIVGAALAVVWLVCRYLLSATVTASHKLAGCFSLTYFGSNAQPGTLWDRLAQKALGEYVWSDEAKAAAYITEKGVAHIPEDATVAVVTSLSNLNEESVNRVVEALGGKGRVVTFGDDAVYNAETLALMRQSSGIVLLERAFVSKTAAVADVMTVAGDLEKPVYGFVMI